MKRRVAVLLFAAVAAVGLCMAPAAAGESHHGKRRPLVVDDDFGHRHHAKCKFGRARFATISEAVEVADPGATILVCPGLYQETVEVDKKGLTILGARFGQDARGRHGDEWGEAVVEAVTATAKGVVQLLEDGITWDGFVIRGLGVDRPNHPPTSPGMYTAPNRSGYSIRNTVFLDNGLGIHLGSNGTRPTTICQNHFVANNEFEAPGAGSAIYSNEGARHVLIVENRFEDHNGAAILFADRGTGLDKQQDIRVERNKSVNDRAFAAFYATSQVALSRNKAQARVDDPQFPREDQRLSAIFFGARNDDVLVQRNRVESASGNGIHVTDSAEPGRNLGVKPPTDVVVQGNRVEHAQLSGIYLAPATSTVLVRANTALDNDLVDCEDASADGPVGNRTPNTENNRWLENVGATADPDNICRPSVERQRDQPKHSKAKHSKKQKQHEWHHARHDRDACGCGLPWRY